MPNIGRIPFPWRIANPTRKPTPMAIYPIWYPVEIEIKAQATAPAMHASTPNNTAFGKFSSANSFSLSTYPE